MISVRERGAILFHQPDVGHCERSLIAVLVLHTGAMFKGEFEVCFVEDIQWDSNLNGLVPLGAIFVVIHSGSKNHIKNTVNA